MAAIVQTLLEAWLELQWGHGREAMDGTELLEGRSPRDSFNGAMAVRPWMAESRVSRARERRGFNGAMAVRP